MTIVSINADRSRARAAGELFYKGKPCPHGHDGTRYVSQGQCVGCRDRRREYWHTHKRQVNLTKRATFHRRMADPVYKAKMRERQRTRYGMGRNAIRRSATLLGIPLDTIRAMPECCESCNRASERRLHLDHDHVTGKFRGWLCSECNLGLGKLGDNLTGVMNILDYLLRNT